MCPWRYIGKKQLDKAIERIPLIKHDIHWLPFQLAPDIPDQGIDRQLYLDSKFGSRQRAQQIYAKINLAGKKAGLDFNFDAIKKSPNTFNAHRLIHWASLQNKQHALVEILFRYFFIEGQDISQHAILEAAYHEAGINNDNIKGDLASNKDRQHIEYLLKSNAQISVQGVPYFIINNEYALPGAQTSEAWCDIFTKMSL